MMRRLLLYALLLLALAALLRVDFYFSIVYLVVLVYLLARMWMRRAGAGLRFARHGTTRAFVGQRVTVEVEVRNTSRLPLPWVEVRESLPVALTSPPFRHQVFSLGAGEAATFRYTLDCRQRGYHSLGTHPQRSRGHQPRCQNDEAGQDRQATMMAHGPSLGLIVPGLRVSNLTNARNVFLKMVSLACTAGLDVVRRES